MLRTVERVVEQVPLLEEMILRREDRTTLKEHLAQLHELRRHASKLGSVVGHEMANVASDEAIRPFISFKSGK
jgi:hypothetical protein